LLFLSQINELPAPHSSERVDNGFLELRRRAKNSDVHAIEGFAEHVLAHPIGAKFLAAIFGNSPFLTHCLLRDLSFTKTLLERKPEELCSEILVNIPSWQSLEQSDLMAKLRDARLKVALLVAAADIGGLWTLSEVTRALSTFASVAIKTTVNHLLIRAAAIGDLKLRDERKPALDCGFTIFGMGKVGASELNYSSDIDLIALFDEEKVSYTGSKSVQDLFVRLTRELVKMLQTRTADGYVFRMDLRLRPDTGSAPLAMSMAAAESYYESVGQNWERAALIKATPVAGDVVAGNAFLDRISPFIWRKYLDFAAIEDIHSIKRQIHAHKGHSTVKVPGHNIKLGQGGIREIEFFAQTQQLIAGGREPSLRVPDTYGALEALVSCGRLEREVATELEDAYSYLRRLEHRLQMIADEQTHSIPASDEGLAHLAVFMGFPKPDSFLNKTLETLRLVERHYAHLFEHAPALGDVGNLVFTGAEDDPETIVNLKALGYVAPSTTAALIRNWHHGHYRAMRSARARELLTELTPALLRAFARTANPSTAVLKFDEFLKKLPAGVQIFSLFYANPSLLDLVAEIMGSAPRLAEHLARNPRLMDNVLSPDFYDPIQAPDKLAVELSEAMKNSEYYEEKLDASRRWGHDQAFQAGVHILRSISTAHEIGPKLADVADVILEALFQSTEAEFVQVHGKIEGGAFAIVALGKYGARELIPESDLDLTFIYGTPHDAKTSNGKRPLSIADYYSRLSKRVINSISALTAEGRLYEVDMRLRPSGASGPIAVHIDGFRDYQKSRAWTWEHMALTRARVIVAPPAFRNQLEELIKTIIRLPRNPISLLADVANMHERVERKHGTNDIWQVKYARGGLLELEFLCQYLILRHARQHQLTANGGTIDSILELRDTGAIDETLVEELSSALRLMRNTQGFLRQTLQTGLVEDCASEDRWAALARATGLNELEALKMKLRETQERVHELFEEIIINPAREQKRHISDNDPRT
tara:strand:+ start:1905 stop:4880 length:2976 start_codon:yes stop_codon:yes gene_type:complete